MTGFDERVRAAARELDRPDALAEFLAHRDVEDAYRERTATPDGRAALDAAAGEIGTVPPGGARAGSVRPRPVQQPVAEADLEALADAAAGGSAAAREELAVRLWPMLARYCAARRGGASAGPLDGVVQDVLRSVLDLLRDRGDRPVRVHAYAVAARCMTDHLRRSAPGIALSRAGTAVLLEALERLPRGQRDVLVLRVLLGCSAEETAEHLGTTPGAVRVAQHRALTAVRATGPAGS